MQSLNKIVHCKKGRRCNRPLSCPTCGSNWQRGKFKGFSQCLDNLDEVHSLSNTPLTYIVITPNRFGTLGEKSKVIFELLEKMKELKKRKKLPLFFGRLEFSIKNISLGFNPHLNLIVWGDYSIFKKLSHELNLRFWFRKKTNDMETVQSIAWYMLKFNKIGIEEGEAVRKLLDKKRTISNSREFAFKDFNYINEYIDIDFSFMGVYSIKSKEEIRLEKEHRETLKKLRIKLEKKKKKAHNQMWNN
jgi:hypothetical protein